MTDRFKLYINQATADAGELVDGQVVMMDGYPEFEVVIIQPYIIGEKQGILIPMTTPPNSPITFDSMKELHER